QNYNAPVGEDAAFAYATALNHLLSFNSRQKIRIGDTTTVFWTERDSPVEGFMGFVFDPGDDGADTADVRRFLEAVRDGNMPEEIKDPDMRFYILGLSPNASRLSVRFWHVSTVKDMLDRIGRHFRDLSILPQYDSEPEFPPMWRLLLATAAQGKAENISPVLSGGFTRSMLTGAPYPQTLLTAVISRIRADRNVSYFRAAMIKAFLVRKHREDPEFMEVKMALDEKSTNTFYRLGRLFAILERAQEEAVKAGASIKDKFFSSACATPAKVFPHLVGLNQHHMKKIRQDKKGYAKWLDKKIEEITNGIEPFEEDREGFPAHLSADEQGLFILGYYQQRKDCKDWFTKKTDDQETEED
ncbi:MAG: type I-C CRISPR-associated protein Cas8c/Csd1, partial [Thermodesulfobacteriota bacterium]|nr:type I-C CRISPR-associated protein Cas8c/Csd1 [Thermodesulfobacteriota bacterium]